MIYTRFGSLVTLVRPVTTEAEVEKITHTKSDAGDRDRLAYGMYAVATIEGFEGERLVDLGILRADDGISEINKAARGVGCNPK